MPKPSKRIVWPAYLDAQKTRKQGRIISKREAVNAPDVKEIMHAATQLGLNPSYEEGKSFPRLWWDHKGRVLIDTKGPKRQAIRQIASDIHASRTSTV